MKEHFHGLLLFPLDYCPLPCSVNELGDDVQHKESLGLEVERLNLEDKGPQKFALVGRAIVLDL